MRRINVSQSLNSVKYVSNFNSRNDVNDSDVNDMAVNAEKHVIAL